MHEDNEATLFNTGIVLIQSIHTKLEMDTLVLTILYCWSCDCFITYHDYKLINVFSLGLYDDK